MVEFEYICYAVTMDNHIPRYLYDFGDYQQIVTKLLETDWSQIFDTLSADDGWMYFHKVLVSLIDEYVPTLSTCTRKHSEWMTKPVLHKIRLKRKAWMKYKITQTDSDYLAYIKCRNEATKAVKESKHCYEKELAESILINPKGFWKYVNSKIKVKRSLSELQRSDGSLTNCDSEMANILNDYFATVFITEDTTNMPSLGDVCSGNCLAEITISIDDVWNQLLALNPSKSGGPDGCHPRVLKEVREGIATPLYLIFKRSLEEGKVPTAWKDASVTA